MECYLALMIERDYDTCIGTFISIVQGVVAWL